MAVGLAYVKAQMTETVQEERLAWIIKGGRQVQGVFFSSCAWDGNNLSEYLQEGIVSEDT